jgi:hypothetical protein
MESNIFESRKERELQRLRQRQASNIVKIDPSLKGFLQRVDPDVSRATLLQLQRQRVPTKEQLEKTAGVKTAKKLKRRKGKNLRGEVAKILREQRRFEKGERRDKPEQEPRIVGDPTPSVPQAGGGLSYDPEVERERIRVQALGQLQTSRIANRRLELEARQLDINRQQSNTDRAELQRQFNLQDRRKAEQLDLERQQLQSILDRQEDDRERFDQDIRERKKERKLQRDIQTQAFAQAEEDRRLAEKRLGAEGSREIERLRVEEESKERELDLLERRIELEEQRYQTQQRDLDPQPEGLSQADKEFLQRGFEQGLSEVERRIGESEARTQQQIKEHAERVATRQAEQAEQQGQPVAPVEIKLVQPEVKGPTAEEVAKRVRDTLVAEGITITPDPSPRQRVEIEEVEEVTPVSSPRPTTTPQSTGEELPPELFESAELVDPSNLPQEGGQELLPRPKQKPKPPAGPPPASPKARIGPPTEPPPESPKARIGPPTQPPTQPPQAEQQGEPQGELFQSQEFQGGIEAAAQNAIGFVGDVAGRAAGGIAGLVFGEQEPKVGEQTGGRLDPEGQIFGLGQEIEPTIQPLQSEQPERRPPQTKDQPKTLEQEIKELTSTIQRKKTTQSFLQRKNTPESREQLSVMRETLRELGRDLSDLKSLQREEQKEAELQALGTVETEADAQAESTIGQSTRRTNFQLYESIRPDIEALYNRGRPSGGARGQIPITLENTTDRKFKGLEPGQKVNIAQIERDGRLGYYPTGFQIGKKGIVRINQTALEKALKDGKLKVDRS